MVKKLNLIPKKSFEELTASKKIFFWMIGVGRIVVVGTELIAILVWLSRFKLDYDISILNETLEDKKEVVVNAQELEENVRTVQKKAKYIRTIDEGKLFYNKALDNFTELVPTNVSLSSLNLDKSNLNFHVKAKSVIAFASLISSLLTADEFENITLTTTNFNPKDGTFSASLTIDVLPEAFE